MPKPFAGLVCTFRPSASVSRGGCEKRVIACSGICSGPPWTTTESTKTLPTAQAEKAKQSLRFDAFIMARSSFVFSTWLPPAFAPGRALSVRVLVLLVGLRDCLGRTAYVLAPL